MAQKETGRSAHAKGLSFISPPLEVQRGIREAADAWLSDPALTGHFISDDVSEGPHDRSTIYWFTDAATCTAFRERWITVH